ncbi:hypothetical protein EJB05_40190 [Eragrostis curvula]|uniref:N-acetylglucosaminylphosphatidylinositol deacetylase n=1 Tax=Eragrostis curvula TaxID=38414 RepID=A0A5J9TZM0_9POAL|nr:hypothetical protein EJB05_40190 [Eragrostis curvula]
MAWIWMLPAAGAVLLWAISLGRILSSPAPSSLPPNPHLLPPLRDDRRSRNVLLVVAHPDDESMFFAPTIFFLKSKGHNIHILCMSQGNADGLGHTRKDELYYACDTFKIPRKQVKVLDHPKLQDGFHEKWDHGLLAGLTMEQVQLWDIDTILTFDSYGVSGHPNHQDVHHGICKYLQENGQGNIEAWELVSLLHEILGPPSLDFLVRLIRSRFIVERNRQCIAFLNFSMLSLVKGIDLASLNILRKYSGPVDIWLSSLISSSTSKRPMYTLINSSPSRSYQAMAAHKSQWVWYRRLFVMFSSYTYINILQKV